MCIKAHDLAKNIAHQKAATAQMIGQESSDLYRVRHYVGRLSAWLRAGRNVVVFGARLQGILDNYCVKIVPPATLVAPISLDLGENFDVILNRMLPTFRGQPILSEISATVKNASGATAFFKGEQLQLKPHAEAIMLDHFSTNNLQFANGDSYVACSRPSCYCCKLYFDSHPSGARTGRSHGMLWIKWLFPQLIQSLERTANHVTLEVLRKMSDQVRQDALAALVPQKHHDFDMFGSTTGFSTSHIAS
jgi:hypothetical protein